MTPPESRSNAGPKAIPRDSLWCGLRGHNRGSKGYDETI